MTLRDSGVVKASELIEHLEEMVLVSGPGTQQSLVFNVLMLFTSNNIFVLYYFIDYSDLKLIEDRQ